MISQIDQKTILIENTHFFNIVLSYPCIKN